MIVSDWTRRLRTELGVRSRRRGRRKPPKNRKHRRLAVEPLDQRQLLSATVIYAALVVQDANAPPPVEIPETAFGGGAQPAAMAAATNALSLPASGADDSMATSAADSSSQAASATLPAGAVAGSIPSVGEAGNVVDLPAPQSAGGSGAPDGAAAAGADSGPFSGQAAIDSNDLAGAAAPSFAAPSMTPDDASLQATGGGAADQMAAMSSASGGSGPTFTPPQVDMWDDGETVGTQQVLRDGFVGCPARRNSCL
jgi:hypothetical protein